MPYLSRPTFAMPPRNLLELLLCDVSSLLFTSKFVSRSLLALRPKCEFSRELTATLDSIIALSNAGELRLHPPLDDAGAVLPEVMDETAGAQVADFFTRPPLAAGPGLLAAEVAANLRLLAQHLELKARLAAEEALLVGQHALGNALVDWSADWRACGHKLRAATVRARAQAYVADLDDFAAR
ncbi:MAG: hypothetical protein JWQ83_219 [Lacunisphaera sp.]|nr:hypothetical protein [Lacunisphaera sp.]MDB6165079.1 hypothetical protein [Lacunisphaera sp.]